MITDYVKKCIAEHNGGEQFFDALDALISQDRHIMSVLEQIGSSLYDDVYFICSGKFGVAFSEWYTTKTGRDCICLEGSLRFNEIKNVEQYAHFVKGSAFVFVDDTHFAGRTKNKVKDLIQELGGLYVGTVVAYDGAKHKEPDVDSLIRYYDHFGEKK
jgi:hypothetical protein